MKKINKKLDLISDELKAILREKAEINYKKDNQRWENLCKQQATSPIKKRKLEVMQKEFWITKEIRYKSRLQKIGEITNEEN